MNDTPRYSVRIFWSDADGGYVATCPELRDLSAFGETEAEALREIREAIQLAVETYREEGWDLPGPAGQQEFSGQFRVRIPKSVHAALSALAQEEETSLNTLVVNLLSEALGAYRLGAVLTRHVRPLVEDLHAAAVHLRSALVQTRSPGSATETLLSNQSPLTALRLFSVSDASSQTSQERLPRFLSTGRR